MSISLWNLPPGTITPRSHMLLRGVMDEEIYIADVGFGGLTLTAPLSLTPDIEQATPHEVFRLLTLERTYIMQVYINQEWKSLYHFDLQEQQLPDYEASNWYVSTYPNSLFTTTLLAAKPSLDCRYALRNNQFTVHYLDGSTRSKLGECLKVKLPYYQIARSIGITYEECVRLTKSLKSVISYSRGGKITILDGKALEATANGTAEVNS